jgi:hypothetical protein
VKDALLAKPGEHHFSASRAVSVHTPTLHPPYSQLLAYRQAHPRNPKNPRKSVNKEHKSQPQHLSLLAAPALKSEQRSP